MRSAIISCNMRSMRFSKANQFWDGFLRKLINKHIGKNTGIKNEIKIGASIVIALWWRTLKTLASTEVLIVHLLCTILLRAGCRKRNPTGETSFYPEKLEVMWRLQNRNGWEGTPSKSETEDNPARNPSLHRVAWPYGSFVGVWYASNRDDRKTCASLQRVWWYGLTSDVQ